MLGCGFEVVFFRRVGTLSPGCAPGTATQSEPPHVRLFRMFFGLDAVDKMVVMEEQFTTED